MKTPFEKFLEEHQDDLNSIYGSLNNLIVKDRFSDMIGTLEKYRIDQEQYGKYKKLKDRFDLSQLGDDEVSSLFTTKVLDKNNPDLQGDPVYREYMGANKMVVNDNELDQYLKQNSPNYENYLTEQQIPYDPKLYEEAVFKKAGFTNEEKDLFGKYRTKDIDAHNKNLLNYLLSNEANLNSMGSLGNSLSTKFMQMGSNYALTPPVQQTLKPVISNNRIYYFDKAGNLVKTEDFSDKNKNEMKEHWNNPKNWWVEKDESGNYYYATNFNDNGAWTVKRVRDLTSQEKADYEASLLEGENKSSGRRYRSGRRYSSGPKKKTDENTSGLDDSQLDGNPEDGDVNPELWADTQNAVNKNKSKYDNWQKNKEDWDQQRQKIAEDLIYYRKLWESNTLTPEQMMQELDDYVKDLQENDFAPEIIQEAKDAVTSYMKGNR